MHVVDMVFHWARVFPHRRAIIQSEMLTTYQGLAHAVESIGERIDRLNLSKRDAVAVCIANPSFMLAAIFALLRGGYNVAPVNTGLYPHLAGVGIRNLIYDTQGQVASGGRNVRFEMSWLPAPNQEVVKRSYKRRPIENADLVFFTSGTTGLPKKAVMTAAGLGARLSYPFTCATGAHDKILIMPGLASSFGLNRACETFHLGKTACFAPDSVAALSLINLFGVEVVCASPVQALSLAEARIKNPGYRVDSLETIFVAGGRIDSAVLGRIRTALCRSVINDYGSTEAGTAGLTPFELLGDAPGAIAFPWVDLEVVDQAGERLPAGAEGLVRIRSPQLKENLKAAAAGGDRNVRDGWFYPGDLGSLDEEGVVHLAGRSSDTLNQGGVKVSGTRIEEILKALPEIEDAAAYCMVGPSGLEEVWVAVVANGTLDIAEIKQQLRQHRDVGIAPDEIVVVDELPRGELGKVQKHRLKELLLGAKNGVQRETQ
jgi:acyl-coenzyme A synthetase/AMP-(fatty) acid ligase